MVVGYVDHLVVLVFDTSGLNDCLYIRLKDLFNNCLSCRHVVFFRCVSPSTKVLTHLLSFDP